MSSTGTNLASAVVVLHLPSANGKAYHVNTKSAATAVPVAGDKALLVTIGTLDSVT